MRKTIMFFALCICNVFTQIKNSMKKFKEADDAVAMMTLTFIGGIIFVVICLAIVIIIIMNIDKIAMAILIVGIGMVAIVGALKLAESGLGWLKKKT